MQAPISLIAGFAKVKALLPTDVSSPQVPALLAAVLANSPELQVDESKLTVSINASPMFIRARCVTKYCSIREPCERLFAKNLQTMGSAPS